MRSIGSTLSTLLAAGVLALAGTLLPTSAVDSVAAEADPVPKVVLIVGPSGRATDRYRDEAREAADVARQFTSDVIEVYSPDATWPAVRDALRGANLVVYLGHGNGWPSRYRDVPYPRTQNGFGLNPRPGGGDVMHQYFGEGRIAADVRLADQAVVLLHHLCYASGLSEPGLPEGSLAEAKQRVDNFAAGFIAAGADAVIAEAYASPTRYVASILGGRRSVEAIWRTSPTANGHAFAFDSVRSPGFVAQMDPARVDSGFERSIVLRRGLVPPARSAPANGFIADPTLPSLVQTGIRLDVPTMTGSMLAGGTSRLRIPYVIDERRRLPSAMQVSVRWQPLDQTPVDPGVATTIIVPEDPGDVVDPVPLAIGQRHLAATVDVPSVPGRYRVTLTLHDDIGQAFDAISQAMLPTMLVHVTGEVDGAVVAPSSVTVASGDATSLPIIVSNLGVMPWGREPVVAPRGRPAVDVVAATLLGRWVQLGPTDSGQLPPDLALELPPGLGPATSTTLTPVVAVPANPGDYLLILDILIPGQGSLTALGMPPTLVRVTIAPELEPSPIDADAPDARSL